MKSLWQTQRRLFAFSVGTVLGPFIWGVVDLTWGVADLARGVAVPGCQASERAVPVFPGRLRAYAVQGVVDLTRGVAVPERGVADLARGVADVCLPSHPFPILAHLPQHG